MTAQTDSSRATSNTAEKAKTRTFYGEYTLQHWIDLLLSKSITLPAYQRSFVWNKDKVQSFIKSLQAGDYIPPVTIAAAEENGKR